VSPVLLAYWRSLASRLKAKNETFGQICNSIARVCGLIVTDPVDPVTQSIGFGEGLKIKQTLALGCPLVVEALWEWLELRKTLQDIEKTAGVQVPYERALLAMVANLTNS
jgi:hypothetical protein